MNLKNTGFDDNSTYFQHNLDLAKIPTVFIHGVGLDNTMWVPQKKFFNYHSPLFYDLVNHGKTKKTYKKLTFNIFNTQLIKLLDYLNIDKINLVGFSIGALIAQHFTSKYYNKINKLIIIASVHKRSDKEKTKVKNRYNLLKEGKSITKDSINRWFNSEYLNKNPDVYSYFFNTLERKKNKYFLPAYKLFVDEDNYNLDFRNFNMPTLIMTGENEIGSTPKMSKTLNTKIKNSKLFIIPNSKHMAVYEKANIVNKKILKFIS
tara:strand:- start:1168 stop:1953 length:786 start_codon:yes stop_codon:yes gene_type:complete